MYKILKYERNYSIRHFFLVFYPVIAILLRTLVIISYRTMKQQDDEKNDIGIGYDVVEKSGHGPKKRKHNLGNVVKVSGETPVAREKQQTRCLLTIGAHVASLDKLGFLAPYHTFAIQRSEELFLTIGCVVNVQAEKTREQYEYGQCPAKLNWVVHQIKGWQCVESLIIMN